MLGLELGRLPSEISHTMMAAEEVSLMAYYRDDPFGDHRMDVMLAQIAQILWNANVSKKHEAKKLVDFLLFYRKPPAPDDPNVTNSVRSVFSKLMGKK